MADGAFFLCRPMTAQEWLALPVKARASTEDMTEDKPAEPALDEGAERKGDDVISTRTEVDQETGWAQRYEREAGEGPWMLVSTWNYCQSCGDFFTPAHPSSPRHPGYCIGCALDIDDPNTRPGGYSS